MKKILTPFLLFTIGMSILFISGCNKAAPTPTVVGNWTLKAVNGTFTATGNVCPNWPTGGSSATSYDTTNNIITRTFDAYYAKADTAYNYGLKLNIQSNGTVVITEITSGLSVLTAQAGAVVTTYTNTGNWDYIGVNTPNVSSIIFSNFAETNFSSWFLGQYNYVYSYYPNELTENEFAITQISSNQMQLTNSWSYALSGAYAGGTLYNGTANLNYVLTFTR